MLEAGGTYFSYLHAGGFLSLPPDGIFDIGVTELSTAINPATGTPYAPRANYTYRALSEYRDDTASPNNWNASMSYVTGSHSMKVGYQGAYQAASTIRHSNPTLLSYNFNQGVPTAFTVRIPEWGTADRTWTQSFFAQDTWTRGRLTLQGALRYDHAWSWAPADGNGAQATSLFNPQPIAFERTTSVEGYHDITPRLGIAYDLFGNGKTAAKVFVGRYVTTTKQHDSFNVYNYEGEIDPRGAGHPALHLGALASHPQAELHPAEVAEGLYHAALAESREVELNAGPMRVLGRAGLPELPKREHDGQCGRPVAGGNQDVEGVATGLVHEAALPPCACWVCGAWPFR